MAVMASTAPDNAEQLRRRANRRLLGASILLLIAIIAVPMFLEREPPPLPDNVDVQIPSIEGGKFDPKFPPVSDAKKVANEKPAEIAVITEPTGAQATLGAMSPLPAPAPAAPVVQATPAPVPATPAKAPAKAAGSAPIKESTPAERKAGQLVVQVIAVRDAAVAKQTYDKAKALKFPVYTEKIDVTNGVVIRVRVGPFGTKQQAESARAKLAQAGLEAKVITLQ